MSPHLPVFRPELPDADRLLPYLRRIDRARIYTNWGPLTSEFENRLAERFEGAHVVSASSGTAALIGAVLASAGRAAPDRPLAIIPAMTFVATALAAQQCGYEPYLVDVGDDWCIEMDRLASHPELHRVGVVIAVAPFGRAVPQSACRAFRDKTGIPVVIDGAGCFEQIVANPVRSLGPIPVALSFHATKAFATGEGGCVVVRDETLSEKVVAALNFGFWASRDTVGASTNGKMSEYHAAVGLAELDGWAGKSEALAAVSQAYHDLFAVSNSGHRLIAGPTVARCYALLETTGSETALAVQQALAAHEIDTRFWYGGGLHVQPYFRSACRDALPVTESLLSRLVGLPVASDLPRTAIERIAAAVAAAA